MNENFSPYIYRARRRLDKEDLFGYILRATLLPLTDSKDGGDITAAKRKPKEHTSPATVPRTSPLIKPFMDISLNENANSKSCKENLSPNVNPAVNLPKENLARNSPPIRFRKPPAHTSPQFPQFSGPRFPGPFMFNNMFHPTLFHGMLGLPGGTPPSPISLATPPSPLSTPPSPVLNGMVRPPSPEQQYNGVDLLVTNINESVPKKEIKKKLASVFREHSKVRIKGVYLLMYAITFFVVLFLQCHVLVVGWNINYNQPSSSDQSIRVGKDSRFSTFTGSH